MTIASETPRRIPKPPPKPELSRLNGLFCQMCDIPLKGRQTKFCSRKCANKRYHADYIDPEYYERLKKHGREYRREKRKDPEYRERINKYNRERRKHSNLQGFFILASIGLGKDDDIKCAHCGCPHIKMLTFGHPNGRENKMRGAVLSRWIIRASHEQIIKEGVRIECNQCNHYENNHREYPPKDELPKWS